MEQQIVDVLKAADHPLLAKEVTATILGITPAEAIHATEFHTVANKLRTLAYRGVLVRDYDKRNRCIYCPMGLPA